MNKDQTRPLLVKALERARTLEESAYQSAMQATRLDWPELATLKEEWDRKRLARARAEMQLWLADRQWEREEAERAERPTMAPEPA